MWERGYLRVATIRGVPIRIHWTMPLGALLFGGLRFAPAFWVGFLLLLLVHELGHAALVRKYGHRVLSVDITGFGGLCRWSGWASPNQRGVIAWGGVLAQAALLVVVLAALLVVGLPSTWFGAELVSVLVWTNLWLIGLNLLPFPPLDGAEAWPLVRRLLGGRAGRRGSSPLPRPKRRPGESWRY
jgi:Zn-dependent protease